MRRRYCNPIPFVDNLDTSRSYLRLLPKVTVLHYFVPSSDMYRDERRPSECVPHMGHHVHILSEPRGPRLPQDSRHHLGCHGATDSRVCLLVTDTSNRQHVYCSQFGCWGWSFTSRSYIASKSNTCRATYYNTNVCAASAPGRPE